jgi:GxxExxY protein
MKVFDPLPLATERLATVTVDAAFRVHRMLGPGLLESVYEVCLTHELQHRGLVVETQVPVPIMCDGVRLDAEFRLDMLVVKELVLELKALEVMHSVFEGQLLTYLKLTGHRLGLLINFNVALIKDGIKRVIL